MAWRRDLHHQGLVDWLAAVPMAVGRCSVAGLEVRAAARRRAGFILTGSMLIHETRVPLKASWE